METKVRCLRAPRNLFLSSLKPNRVSIPLEPTIDTTNIRFRTLKSPNVSKMEAWRKLGLIRKSGRGTHPMRRPPKRRLTPTCRKRRRLIANRTAAMDRQSEKALSFMETHVVNNSNRYCHALLEFLQRTLVAENPLLADAEVHEALVAFFGSHFLPRSHRALQGWKRRTPPRSRDPHVWCIWTVLVLEFSRHGLWSMGVYLLWMVTCYFRPGEPLSIQSGDIQIPLQGISSRHQVLLYPGDRKICGQRHGRVVLSLVRELALDCNSSQPWKPHRTRLQLQLSRLLGGVE